MSVIRTDCCDSYVDLDFNCDDIVTINNEWYHRECAYTEGLITEEQYESLENDFYTKRNIK